MSDSDRCSGAHLLIAFLAGAATGAAVAFLTAPRSGRETRESLRDWAQEARDKAGRVPRAVREACGRASQAAREAFLQALKDSESEAKES